MAMIKLDPVTRLEGHMKVEVEIDDTKKVIAARSTGNMFRGFENLLKGRDPRDAVHLTQRICGLCPVSHGIASVKAIEKIQNYKPTGQARLLRNLIQGGNYVSDHILHFYHLSLLDYVKGPDRSPWDTSYDTDMRFSKKAGEELFKNYVKALEMRRKAHEMVTLFAGRIPHVRSIMPGGVTKTPTREEIETYKTLLKEVGAFINNEYYSDVQKIASVYKDYYDIGKGYENFISFGVFEIEGNKTLSRRGRYTEGKYYNVDENKITEDPHYAWYTGNTPETVRQGQTNPRLDKETAYTWIKAPRYQDIPHEAGPLARMWIDGEYRKGVSVMDRHVARMLESKKLVKALSNWINELEPNVQEYDASKHTLPKAGASIGMTEAPRGALLHYLKYDNNLIQNYQIITPTCWNASPKDRNEIIGPMEKALIGIQIKDVNHPVELMRVIHSFDPCTACAVHIIDIDKKVENKFVISTPRI